MENKEITAEAKKFRKEQGLREIRKGQCKCLRCDKRFLSQDIKAIRLCDVCRDYLEASRATMSLDE